MKRSTRVVLTLLAPAMAAFGCGQSTPPAYQDSGNQTSNDCSSPAKPGEPEKPVKCPVPASSIRYGSSYRRSPYIPMFGGTSGGYSAPSHASSSSHTSWGGFGGSSSHFSGGS